MRKASSAKESPADEFAVSNGGTDGLTELRLLQRATPLVLSTAPVDEVLTELMKLMAAAARARGVAIVYCEPMGRLVPGLHLMLPPAYLMASAGAQVGDGACGRAIERGAPVVVADTRSDASFAGARAQALELGIVAVVAAPIVASDGVSLGALACHFDRPHRAEDVERSRTYAGLAAAILEHKRAEASGRQRDADAAAATAAIRRRQEYLAIVSHDLRNPLSAILTSATLLQQGEKQREGSRRQTDVIIRSVRHMDRLITDLLDISQIESGRFQLRWQAHGVKDLVREAVEGIQAQAHRKHLTIEVDVAPEVTSLRCDGERLLQVLGNLLGNAVKFTPEGGVIRVGAAVRDDALEFSVEDTGIGITANQLARIFDRYWQAQRRARQGVGLGLSIARGIVEAHGGRILVESAAGVGTKFRFTIPLQVLVRWVEALAEFCDLPVATARTLLGDDERGQAWEAGPAPGVGFMAIPLGPRHRGAWGFLIRIAPGASYPYHRHASDEHLLIIEGGLRDDDGAELWEGERAVHREGTAHASTAIGEGACLLAAIMTSPCSGLGA